MEGLVLLKSEWQIFYPQISLSQAKKIPCMEAVGEHQWQCSRCQSISQEKVPAGYYYCPACLALGRMTSRDFLYYFPKAERKKRAVLLDWPHKLSPSQKEISDKLLQSAAKESLLWAVTGAGKTEILFQLLQQKLSCGCRVVLTSPRVDVCNELYLRLSVCFPAEAISLYHGQKRIDGSGQLVICTTHQLLRFKDYFDLVVVDEVDAFPYKEEPLLSKAVEVASAKDSQKLYLTATPDENLKKISPCYQLPARFHRRQLPEPRVLLDLWLEKSLRKARLSKKVMTAIEALLQHNHVLIFCPSVALLKKIAQNFQEKYPTETVYANDRERLVKVERMRQGQYQILLTTTILERGVTFEHISVVVLQANHRIFNKAALVQISGRADRKGAYHYAQVIFIASEWTSEMRQALKEIKANNQLARKRGLIHEM